MFYPLALVDFAYINHYCAFSMLLAMIPKPLIPGAVRIEHCPLAMFSVILIFAHVRPAVGPPILATAVQQIIFPLS